MNHHVAVQITLRHFQACPGIGFGGMGDHKVVCMRRTLQIGDRNLTLDIDREREPTCRTRIDLSFDVGGQWIDVGRLIVIEVELLIVGQTDPLFRPGSDRKDAEFKRLVVNLFKQSRVAANRFVALIDLACTFLFHHFTNHLFAIDDHAEVADARVVRNREGVERFDNPLLFVEEDLINVSDRHTIVDGHADLLLHNLEFPSQPPIGDQQSGGLRTPCPANRQPA